jgi:hypothetical protein
VTPQRVWTFTIFGGQSFRLTLTGNPPLDHDGVTRTMWKLVGTRAAADAAKILIEEQGCRVELHTEETTEEMRAARIAEQFFGVDLGEVQRQVAALEDPRR